MTHPKLQILKTVTLGPNHFAKKCQHQHGETYQIKVFRKQPRGHVISVSLVPLQDMIEVLPVIEVLISVAYKQFGL